MKNRLKTTTLLALALAISAASSQAVYIFTSANQTITETFTDYAGTAAPANWVLDAHAASTPSDQAGFNGQLGSTVNAANTTASWRSYGSTLPTVSSDRSLGFLGNGTYGPSANPATMTASYTNNTGSFLTGISIGYTGEQWLAQVSRDSAIAVSYSLDGTNYISLGNTMRFLAPNIPLSGATFAVDGNAAENRIVFAPFAVNLATPIADGDTFYVRFSYTGGTTSGVRQGLSIDDVTVTVVPEPATTALLFGAGLMVLAYRFRRRNKLS